MITSGVDAGSRAIKVVVLDGDAGAPLGYGAADQGIDQEAIARDLFGRVLAESGVARDAVHRIIATGYGRQLIGFADGTVTEITCQAAGVHHLVPDTRTIVDLGGQDSKVIRLNGTGAVNDFVMNDRCAAGTGRFLEVVATRLGVRLDALGELAGRSVRPAAISSMCVVFAETEIIGLLASGVPREDICAGVQRSIAARVAAMAGRAPAVPVVFTGGGALVPGMAEALGRALSAPVQVAPHPQYTGALGAAILAGR